MIGLAWAEEVVWHGPRFGLPRFCCLSQIRKLLEFDFSTTIDGAVKDEVAKIGAAEDEVSAEQTVECKVVVAP
ncbi:L-type lectin-domain containing receptor kinase S.5 [Pyrus ussuriensis x Pyrus communis]|uniref:L-type lectin-domain containing receptor kinase S.5 n=1 Tax=Pyrus ussuriensis x Pyrus communis TaxID=2448454 RepID=A0A5N5F4T6_9ROSA|nr:L-type lectin-domain containing receptor kinase S.5 [Pyrus ussuriensis x Pyrus communis]